MPIAWLQPTMGLVFIAVWLLIASILFAERRGSRGASDRVSPGGSADY